MKKKLLIILPLFSMMLVGSTSVLAETERAQGDIIVSGTLGGDALYLEESIDDHMNSQKTQLKKQILPKLGDVKNKEVLIGMLLLMILMVSVIKSNKPDM